MKLPGGLKSSKCFVAALLKAAHVRKMDKKDDEADESEEQRKKPKPEESEQQENVVGNSSTESLTASNSKTGSGVIEGTPVQGDKNAGSESTSQAYRGILRDEANLRKNSEEWAENASRRESSPRIQIRDTNISVESLEIVEFKGSASSSKRSNPSSVHSESIEGESELENQEMGPTLGQYRYQSTREDYEALSKSLKEKTINTLIHLGEIHKSAYVDSQAPTMKAPVPPRLSEETAEAQLYIIDKELKSIARRINESKREQAYTLQRINDLEVKMFKRQGAEYIRDIMTKIPNQEDLKDMEQIRQLMLERKRLQKEIEKLKMEMSSMNKAMANADVIISDCAAIKKPRKVVICTKTPSQPAFRSESSSRDIIGSGETPQRSISPPTTDSSDLAVATGSGRLVPESQQTAVETGSGGSVPEPVEPTAEQSSLSSDVTPPESVQKEGENSVQGKRDGNEES